VNWADRMAAQGAVGTDFYDRSTRTIVGTTLLTEYSSGETESSTFEQRSVLVKKVRKCNRTAEYIIGPGCFGTYVFPLLHQGIFSWLLLMKCVKY